MWLTTLDLNQGPAGLTEKSVVRFINLNNDLIQKKTAV
jgi:hypothetical protein